MVPRRYIQEWAKFVPWQEPRQIEQDLIITNALLKIYGHEQLRENLAFRGGTALNKLYFTPPSRYSEDIDLVQINAESIGETIDNLRSVMDYWLGEPRRNFCDGRVTLSYRTISDDGFPVRLKLEINTREHFSVLGHSNCIFESQSSWASGRVEIKTYAIEELLGTKLRALYQRRKGRDLYDLYVALTTLDALDHHKLLDCFQQYMNLGGHRVSKKQFIENITVKMLNKEFCGDMTPLLPSKNRLFDPNTAYECVMTALIDKI